MSTRNLECIFAPRSVAVVGASPRPSSLGRTIHANILAGGFPGPVHVVNPRYSGINGVATVASLAALPGPPDLVVITAPPAAVPGIVEEAGKLGVGAAIVVTAGLGRGPGSHSAAMSISARRHGVRLVGPNCLGVLAPKARLNASFAPAAAEPGDLALLSQSGAIVTAVVDWASDRGVGFSGVVSMGEMADVDVGDLLDHFATDPGTRAILLYLEAIGDAQEFMSAARAAARAKPVVVVKAGRHAEGARAAASHTGALAGADAVYDAAFRRAGLLRVIDLDELFSAAQTLSHLRPVKGDRLAIVTNGGGAGVIAVDRLVDLGGRLAELSPGTIAALDGVLPHTWSRTNPVDIIGDAGPERYAAALAPVLADPGADAVLVIHCPTALAAAEPCAEAVVEAWRATPRSPSKPLLAAFLGSDRKIPRATFERVGLPSYRTPTSAVRGFMHLVRHVRAQEELMATPPSMPEAFAPDVERARAAISRTLEAGRRWLDPVGVSEVLAAYRIPAPEVRLARTPAEASSIATEMLKRHGAVALKIRSADIIHKSDVGGVVLGLTTPGEVAAAMKEMLERVSRELPQAAIDGVLVQPMIERPGARELIAGLAEDPVFGPVVLFGAGGVAVEVTADTALALPPLHMGLAHDLIGRTRVSRLLDGYRAVPAADRDAVALTLVKLAQLAADLPEVRELDVNPLLADADGVIALDARIAVAEPTEAERRAVTNPRFAIHPYPREAERTIALSDGAPILVRPVRPEDEPELAAFFAAIEPHDLRQRFFLPIKHLPHAFVARFTQIDYARVMVFLAFETESKALLGTVQIHADANGDSAEYAILVRSNLKGRGLGWRLMSILIDHARDRGLREITGQVLRENTTMLAMCAQLGFRIADDPHDPGVAVVTLDLGRPSERGGPQTGSTETT